MRAQWLFVPRALGRADLRGKLSRFGLAEAFAGAGGALAAPMRAH